jgi:hypothetical protein
MVRLGMKDYRVKRGKKRCLKSLPGFSQEPSLPFVLYPFLTQATLRSITKKQGWAAIDDNTSNVFLGGLNGTHMPRVCTPERMGQFLGNGSLV